MLPASARLAEQTELDLGLDAPDLLTVAADGDAVRRPRGQHHGRPRRERELRRTRGTSLGGQVHPRTAWARLGTPVKER